MARMSHYLQNIANILNIGCTTPQWDLFPFINIATKPHLAGPTCLGQSLLPSKLDRKVAEIYIIFQNVSFVHPITNLLMLLRNYEDT